MVNRSDGVPFKVVSYFEPAGDQPNAIQNLVDNKLKESFDSNKFR